MWQGFSWFILSIVEARVVDFPLPVAPVTRTRPLGFLQREVTMSTGRPHSSKVLILNGMSLMAQPTRPLCMKTLTLKRLIVDTPKDMSSSRSFSNLAICSFASMLYASVLASSGESADVSTGTSLSSILNCTGEFAVMCRSEAFLSFIIFRSLFISCAITPPFLPGYHVLPFFLGPGDRLFGLFE